MTISERSDGKDGFGEYGGKRYLKTHNDAWEATLRWRPRAVGRRPQDWATRDLVRGSALREPENWGYRWLARNGHSNLDVDSESMLGDPKYFVQAIDELGRSRAFLFFYYYGLLRQAAYGTDERVMQSLLDCPPNLFEIENGSGYPLRPCRQVIRCPFCLARAGWKAFQKISETLHQQREKFVGLVSFSEKIPFERFDDDETSAAIGGVKDSLKCELRSRASQLGAAGGVTSFQLLPRFLGNAKFVDGDIDIDPTEVELVARSAMLIPLPDRFIAAFAEHFDLSTDFSATAISDVPGLEEWMDSNSSARACRLHIKHLSSTGALRGLVVGTTPGLRVDSRPEGIEGLFVAPQWQLVPASLMSHYERFLQGYRISDCFGNWRGTSQRRQPARRVFDAAHQRRTKQIIRLSAANYRRSQAAEDEARQHLSVVSPVFNQLTNELGRAPGRKRLQVACRDAGHDIPERQIRRLIPILSTGA